MLKVITQKKSMTFFWLHDQLRKVNLTLSQFHFPYFLKMCYMKVVQKMNAEMLMITNKKKTLHYNYLGKMNSVI